MHVFVDALVTMGGIMLYMAAALLLGLVLFILLLWVVPYFERLVSTPIREALARRQRLVEVSYSAWFLPSSLGGLLYSLCLIHRVCSGASPTLPALSVGIALCAISASGVFLSYLCRT